MWIRESSENYKPGIDRTRLKNDINRILAGTETEADAIKYIFQDKGVLICHKDGIRIIQDIYTGPNNTFNMKSDSEVYICIIGKEITTRQIYKMDIELRNQGIFIQGDFIARCDEISMLMRRYVPSVRLLIFEIDKKCILEEKNKTDGIWKQSTIKSNMSNVVTHLEKLKNNPHLHILYDGQEK